MGLLNSIADLARGQRELGQVADRALATLTPEQRAHAPTRSALIASQGQVDRWDKARMIARAMTVDTPTRNRPSGTVLAMGGRGPASVAADIAWRRATGRMLYQYNETAAWAVELCTMFAVGTGTASRLTASTPAVSKKANDELDRWKRSKDCDVHRRKTWAGLQRLFYRTLIGQGEVLVRLRWMPNRRIPVAVQLMETDHIATAYAGTGPNGERCVQGMVYDEFGELIGMYLYKQHPGDGILGPVKADINDVEYVPLYDKVLGLQLQLFEDANRIGMHRGSNNRGAFALDLTTQAANLRGNMLVRKDMEARIPATVTMGPDGGDPTGLLGDEVDEKGQPREPQFDKEGQSLDDLAGEDLSDPDILDIISQRITRQWLATGTIPVMPDGWKFDIKSMSNTGDYQPFADGIDRAIAVAFRVPYALLSMNTKGGSFSNERMNLIPFRKETEWGQEILYDFDRMVLEAFVIAGWSRGRWREREMGIIDRGEPFPMLEPDKDIGVYAMKLSNLMTTLEDVWLELGEDPELMWPKLKTQQERIGELGLGAQPLPFTKFPQFFPSPSGGGGDDAGGDAGAKAAA